TQNMVFHVGIASQPTNVEVFSTDLNGNINWYYDPVAHNFVGDGPTLLPGGEVLMEGTTLGGTLNSVGGADTLREVNLAGEPVRETNINAINAALAAMGKQPIDTIDHEARLLPNGDIAIISTELR